MDKKHGLVFEYAYIIYRLFGLVLDTVHISLPTCIHTAVLHATLLEHVTQFVVHVRPSMRTICRYKGDFLQGQRPIWSG